MRRGWAIGSTFGGLFGLLAGTLRELARGRGWVDVMGVAAFTGLFNAMLFGAVGWLIGTLITRLAGPRAPAAVGPLPPAGTAPAPSGGMAREIVEGPRPIPPPKRPAGGWGGPRGPCWAASYC